MRRHHNGGLLLALLAAITLVSLLLDTSHVVWGEGAGRASTPINAPTPEVRQEILRELVDFIY